MDEQTQFARRIHRTIKLGLIIGFDGPSARFMVRLVDKKGTLAGKSLKIKVRNLISADDVDELLQHSDDYSDTHGCEWQLSQPLSGVCLGPSRS